MKLPILIAISFLSFTLQNCKSTSQEHTKNTVDIIFEPKEDIIASNVYFQEQIKDNQENETVITMFFPELSIKYNYKIDKVYFRNRVGKIISGKASSFATLSEDKNDIIMSNAPNAEYGNTMPNATTLNSFQLKDNECVVSFLNGTEIKYYKIENVIEKPN